MTAPDSITHSTHGALRESAARHKPGVRPKPGKNGKLDVVTIEVMSRKFAAVADEMTTNLKRASRSVYVKEAGDFGTRSGRSRRPYLRLPRFDQRQRDRASLRSDHQGRRAAARRRRHHHQRSVSLRRPGHASA